MNEVVVRGQIRYPRDSIFFAKMESLKRGS